MLQLGYVCLISGLCWAIVGYVGTILGSCWATLVVFVEPMWTHVALIWSHVGPCWAYVVSCGETLGPYLILGLS